MTGETVGHSSAGPTDRTDIDYIAHRGFAGVYPENTLAAVREASRTGSAPDSTGTGVRTGTADAIEIDVLPAAGGEPVVFHDLTLGRLTDVSGDQRCQAVWETPVESLRECSVLGSGEPVPLLEEVMDVIPSGVGVNIELKHPGMGQPQRELDENERARGHERWRPFVERVIAVLAEHDNELLVSSSYEGALMAIRAISNLPLAYLFWNSIEGGLDITRRYDCEAINPPLNMIAGTSLFNSEYIPTGPFAGTNLVETAHDEGRSINVWTVTDWHQATQLRAAGVDGIIADYPGLLGPEMTGTVGRQITESTNEMVDAETSGEPTELNIVSGD